MAISFWGLVGLVFTIAVIIIVGSLSGRKVKDASDFSTGGGRAGKWVVCGAIMGTLISGQSTVGTAQLAFSYGISAWWFTLGAAIGCLILSLAYAIPLRHGKNVTLLEVVSQEYGKKAEAVGSVLCFLGMFVSIVAQVLSASALLTALFPISFIGAALFSIALMIVYVIFGGMWGAGMGGIVKLILLYVSSIVAGAVVFGLAHGYTGLTDTLHQFLSSTALGEANGMDGPEAIRNQYQSLFARGPVKDIGSCLSLVLGVLATQTYAQGIWSGKSDQAARKGGIICALLTPPIGLACILIGLYMRGHYITSCELEAIGGVLPEGIGLMESSSQAFPLFVTNHLPKLFGGVVLGTLLITIVGGGSGLSLGAATILVRDVMAKFKPSLLESRHSLHITRLTIIFILAASVMVAHSFSGSFINDLGFLSMGLRATAVFLPLTCALFWPGCFRPRWMLASMIAGTTMLIVAKAVRLPADPMWWGLAVSLLCCAFGWKKRRVIGD